MHSINSGNPNEATRLLGPLQPPVSSSKRENTNKNIAAIFKESLTPTGQLSVQAGLTKWNAISIKKPEGTVAKVISFVTSISLFQKIKNYFSGAGFKTDATLYTEVKTKNEEFLKNTMMSIHLICGKIEKAINDRITQHKENINESQDKITSFNANVLPVLRLSANPLRIKSAVDQLKATGKIEELSLSSLQEFDYKTILTHLCDNFLSEEEVNTFLDKIDTTRRDTNIFVKIYQIYRKAPLFSKLFSLIR